MIVVFTHEALTDLESIGDYIARDNPQRAETFVNELVDCCERLAETPEGFALVPQHQHLGIRRRPHGRYVIFYRPNAQTVEIIHVLSEAQDYEAILFRDEV